MTASSAPCPLINSIRPSSSTVGSTTTPYKPNATSSRPAEIRDSIEDNRGCCSFPVKVCNAITYPFRVILSYLCRFRLFFYATYPITFIYERCVDLYDSIYYRCENYFSPREKIFPEEEIQRMKEVYWGLGSDTWKEVIDGVYQQHGKRVFDFGLHGHSIEPGFIRSWERGKYFMSEHLGEKLTPELFLQAHKILTNHFLAGHNYTQFGGERSGTFRNENDSINIHFRANGHYNITVEAERELNALDPNIAHIAPVDKDGTRTMRFHNFSDRQVREHFQRFLDEFYVEIDNATTQDDRLISIAKLIQKLSWLHAPPDGTVRTNSILLNFLLTEYGFHPTILQLPLLPFASSLDQWVAAVREGLTTWENAGGTC